MNKKKLQEYKRIVGIIRWAIKNPKKAMIAIEEAMIQSENHRLMNVFHEIKRWQQN